MTWRPSQARSGVAIYNFDARHPHELSLDVGDVVNITEECMGHGWYKGHVSRKKSETGLFPSTFVHLKSPTSNDSASGARTGLPQDDPIVTEVADVLRVWGDAMKQSYVELKDDVVQKLNSSMTLLVKWRRDILLGSMRSDHLLRLKAKIAAVINKCNLSLGLDLVARDDNYDAIEADNVSVLDLYNIHAQYLRNDLPKTPRKFVHLYSSLVSATCSVSGEDTELLFSLYDAHKQEFISERVAVRFGADGTVEKNRSDAGAPFSWLFTDLDATMLGQCQDLYVVCHVVRLGRIDLGVKKPTASIFRRPVGVVVLALAKLRAVVDAAHTMVQISSYMCPVSDEKDFSMLHDQIIRRVAKPNERSGTICLNMQLVLGDLHTALDSHPDLLSKGMVMVRKIGFALHTVPGEVRNDIFITLERGEFEKGGKSTAKNIEVAVDLMDPAGEPLEMIMQSASSQSTSDIQSVILYHNNSPRWGETFRVNIPLNLISDAILLFTIRHCSSTSDSRADKQSVFSYLKLVAKDGTTIQNGLHELCLYRCSPKNAQPSTFTTGPSTVEELASGGTVPSTLALSRKEGFAVSINVCSTKLTQDPQLLALLQWRLHQDRLVSVLENLMNMDGRGVCLFMQDAFDALFYILDIDNKLCNQLVFNALVHFLNYMLQPEYEQFVETLDKYISVHFSGAMAYKKLLTGIRGYIDNAHRPELQAALRQTVCCFHYIFKIIIQSRRLHARASRTTCITPTFKESVEKVVQSLITLVETPSTDAYLQAIQIAALKSLGDSVDLFQDVFDGTELATILSQAVDAVPSSEPGHILVDAKLAFMLVLVKNSIFLDVASRHVLLPTFLANIRAYLTSGLRSSALINVIGEVVKRLEGKYCCEATVEDRRLLSTLLPTLVTFLMGTVVASPSTTPPAETLLMVICSLLGILRLMDTDNYVEMTPTLPDAHAFINDLFAIFHYLLTYDIFDKSWSLLRLIMHNIILVSISSLSETLRPDDDAKQVEQDIMKTYFLLATQFITQQTLQLELLHSIRAGQVQARFGDMRYVMATELVVMWSGLGEERKACVPVLTRPLLQAALVKQEEVRRALLPIFVDLLEVEYCKSRTIRMVSKELFDALDPFISAGCGDYEFVSTAEEIWLGLVTKSTTLDEAACSMIRNLVKRVVLLATRLIDYRSLGGEDRTSAERRRRMLVLYNMVTFYKKYGPHRQYDGCLYKLARLHIVESNWTEAAYALLQVSDNLSFKDNTMLDSVLKYPRQTACNRKEALVQDMVDYFGKGKSFECGIVQCDLLIDLYRHSMYDYTKLRSILSTQAAFFGNIVDEHRPAREYFRVGYYGQGLPRFLRNRTFIYLGLEYEKLTSFQERLLLDYGDVELLKTNEAPGEDITSSSKGYLQVCTVRPCPTVPDHFERVDINERIRDYYEVNCITKFEYSRPFHKGPKDKDNEFKSLWLERTTLTTAWPLPGILAWAEIATTRVTEISPIENAVETMVAKNKQLQTMIASYRSKQASNINPLSMALNGVIDAAVMGGTENYEKAFFIDSYMEENPQHVTQIQLLKRLMLEQVGILERGLEVHKALIPDNLKPFHTKMEASFAQMKEKQMRNKRSSSPDPVFSEYSFCNAGLEGNTSTDGLPQPRPRQSQMTDSAAATSNGVGGRVGGAGGAGDATSAGGAGGAGAGGGAPRPPVKPKPKTRVLESHPEAAEGLDQMVKRRIARTAMQAKVERPSIRTVSRGDRLGKTLSHDPRKTGANLSRNATAAKSLRVTTSIPSIHTHSIRSTQEDDESDSY
ncbi:dedicator of cytokinesis protein 4-like isoform X1 [Sycon ciliatum]|uniref:dedicator of cytokinesis protein 4-like isoform X1 n=1 Tax=Sycon ciliatum TaxID=27933 RepID=UPI0031F6E113